MGKKHNNKHDHKHDSMGGWDKLDRKPLDSWAVGSAGSTYKRCYHDHPALDISGFKIYGGSCSSPIVTDADIYVGFDMSMQRTKRQFPWEQGTEFLYRITDMAAPDDIVSFKKLIEYLMAELHNGKKIHCGCIGGHGRTGTVFSALVNVVTGEKDATTYVRDHYCKKAVESTEQVEFLNKHFGITKVAGHKAVTAPKSSWATGGSWGRGGMTTRPDPFLSRNGPRIEPDFRKSPKDVFDVQPSINTHVCIWGKNVSFDKLPETGIITL